jgi:hypothetical protein
MTTCRCTTRAAVLAARRAAIAAEPPDPDLWDRVVTLAYLRCHDLGSCTQHTEATVANGRFLYGQVWSLAAAIPGTYAAQSPLGPTPKRVLDLPGMPGPGDPRVQALLARARRIPNTGPYAPREPPMTPTSFRSDRTQAWNFAIAHAGPRTSAERTWYASVVTAQDPDQSPRVKALVEDATLALLFRHVLIARGLDGPYDAVSLPWRCAIGALHPGDATPLPMDPGVAYRAAALVRVGMPADTAAVVAALATDERNLDG